MSKGDIRKWLAVGTGVALEVRGADLAVTVVKVRPGGARIVASDLIPRFRERPAAEWGAEYASLLKGAGAGHLTASFLVPRHEVIVRFLPLPGVSPREMEPAIRLQLDSLHPYAEDDVVHGWARLGAGRGVLIGIARRDVIERYALLFAEAGVRVSAFTFSAAAIYSALRIPGEPPREGLLAVAPREEGFEVYGESAAQPVFSAVFGGASGRGLALAAAQLRLDETVEPRPLPDLLSGPVSAPGGWDPAAGAISYAASLAAACRHLALGANLLPAEYRSSSSRLVYAPTAALAGLLLIALLALGIYGGVRERGYAAALSAELARYSPEAAQGADLEAAMERLRARRRLILEFRRQTREDLDALKDLSRVLEPPAWIKSLQLTRGAVMLAGEAPQAAPLIEIIDGSPLFHNSEFTSPIAKTGGVESFAIRAAREPGAVLPPEGAAPLAEAAAAPKPEGSAQ